MSRYSDKAAARETVEEAQIRRIPVSELRDGDRIFWRVPGTGNGKWVAIDGISRKEKYTSTGHVLVNCPRYGQKKLKLSEKIRVLRWESGFDDTTDWELPDL